MEMTFPPFVFRWKIKMELQHCSRVSLGLPLAKIRRLSSKTTPDLTQKFSISTSSLKAHLHSYLPIPSFGTSPSLIAQYNLKQFLSKLTRVKKVSTC